tara:strand:+ start:1265 stop:2320 length:1056 start_codon:yes stop_codon:yes gene_type:complete
MAKDCSAFKQARTIAGSDPIAQEAWEEKHENDMAEMSMIAGDAGDEPVPAFIQTSTEKVLKNRHNAWVVLGRDRPAGRTSGYGGRGDTQAATIDIVVGRQSANAFSHTKRKEGEGKITVHKLWANPDFQRDAARIYISQKTDVDANFGLAAGQIGSTPSVDMNRVNMLMAKHDISSVGKGPAQGYSPSPRSAIALKADGIRLIAREGIKLVTRTDVKNSQGSCIQGIQGVDIIAGNDDEYLQPMVKGDNLQMALERLVKHVDGLTGVVDAMLLHQNCLNYAITHHFHFGFYGQPTTTSPNVQTAGIKTSVNHLSQSKRSYGLMKTNLAGFSKKFLDPTGKKYINSRYNNVN